MSGSGSWVFNKPNMTPSKTQKPKMCQKTILFRLEVSDNIAIYVDQKLQNSLVVRYAEHDPSKVFSFQSL